MSVSLIIGWRGSESLRLPVAGQRSMEEVVCPLAEEIGLELAPHFFTYFPVTHDNIHLVVNELRTLRTAVGERYPGASSLAANLDSVAAALETVIADDAKGGSRGEWEAYFG